MSLYDKFLQLSLHRKLSTVDARSLAIYLIINHNFIVCANAGTKYGSTNETILQLGDNVKSKVRQLYNRFKV